MAPSRLRHPLILFLVENTVSTATAAYTGKHSILRPISFVICIAISWLAISTFHDYIQTTGWAGRTIAGAIFTVPNLVFDRLIVRNWNFEEDCLGPLEQKRDDRTKQSRWEFGSQVSSSTRCVGSSKEAANIPHFSTQDPHYVPTRTTFLLRHFCLVISCYHLNTFAIDTQLRVNQTLLSKSWITLSQLRSISLEEVYTRVIITITYWTAQYCFLQLFYSVFAIIGAIFKPSELKLWRPFFGSIKTSYTIRNFWGKFWHQGMQLNVKGPAQFMTNTILHIPSGTIISRYSNIFFAFFVSGAMHVIADSGGAVSIAESGALNFFCVQAVGILLEDTVQALYRKAFGDFEGVVYRILGYFWVVAWLSWSTPLWVYPVVSTMNRDDMLLRIDALWPLVRSFLNRDGSVT